MMIHKMDGSYHINKLRVIHLFEADYNGTIGTLFNRQLLYHTEQKDLLNNNQWGCRPHRQAEDALMLKELTYNLAQSTKTTLATFDNDATGCFDRVPCTIAMLASRRLGADVNSCRMQADTLQNIQHQLRTAFGLSSATYTSNDKVEIHGQGQGSRAGPPTWVFVSSLLLDCMDKRATGLSFTCPHQEYQHTRRNDAFVDDVTGYVNKFVEELKGRNVADEVVQSMQTDATLWNELLHTSGGKLAFQKCLYYILSWRWKHGRASPIPASEIQPKITLRQDSTTTPIHHVDNHIAHRTLGQMKSPLGDQSAQIQLMTRRSTTWLNAIRESYLTPAEAQTAFDTIWFPSLSYGLGTTNISFDALNNIQKPVVNHILTALRYNRHFPRAVVYGSPQFGGLNFKHLYIEQGTKHVLSFIKYYRHNNSIGNLLRISLRWIRLIAGLSVCPLQRPQTNYFHIPDKWFQTTIRFLSECNAQLETNDHINPLSRIDDSCLMEDFLLFAPKRSETIEFNHCRLFLHATTLSDISDSTGHYITRNCWEGTSQLRSPFLWPIQARPPAKAWRTWRKFLATCYLLDDSDNNNKRQDLMLRTPLGKWLPSHRTLQHREFYFNSTTRTVYQRQHTHFNIFQPTRNTRTLLDYIPTGRTSYLPISSVPIDPSMTSESKLQIYKSSIDTTYTITPTTTTPNSFRDYILTLNRWEQELIKLHTFHTNFNCLLATLQSNFTIATDGSANDGKGSFGWVIANSDGNVIVTGQGTAFGDNISSFRCEGYGILAALRFILQLHQYYHLPQPSHHIAWWCDSKSLLQRLHSNWSNLPNPNRYKLAEHDVEHAITHTNQLLSFTIRQHHLRSHQYDNMPLHAIPIPHRLNRIADRLANEHNATLPHPMTKVPLIDPAGCQLHINLRTVTHSIARRLHYAFTYDQSIRHISHRLHLHTTLANNIAWKAFARAFCSFSVNQQRILRRWIYGFLPTQRRLYRMGSCTSPLCPICQQTVETDHHFLTCGGSSSWNDDLLKPLEQLLHKSHTGQWIELAIRKNLTRFLNHQPPHTIHPWIQPAIDSQSALGWNAVFYGICSTKWIDFHNRSNTRATTGLTLIARLIKLVFQAILSRWNIRNNKLHQTSPQHEVKARLIAQVKALYATKNDVMTADKTIFDIPLTSLLRKQPRTLQLFLDQNKPITQQSIRQRRRLTQSQHHDIASYFIPTTTAHHPPNTRVTHNN